MKLLQRKGWAVLALLLLGGCTQLTPNTPNQTNNPVGDSTAQSSGDQAVVINQTPVDASGYRYILTDGQYVVSSTRGATLSLNSNVNLEQFERGLMQLSKTSFPTSQYYFQEGQYLTSDMVYQWLGRKSDNNPEGLNPQDNGVVGQNTRAPIYLTQILEQNYMLQVDGQYQIGGISIGLALNTTDYYQANNINYTQVIPDSEVEAQGKVIAAEIVKRLRAMPDLADVPITIGLYRQGTSDDLAGGTYFLKTTVMSGDTIPGWEATNIVRVVFPLTSGDYADDAKSFDAFKTQVQNFFPNLNGVVAVAEYHNDDLYQMEIDITTQFYGESEMVAFTEYVTNVATSYLTKNADISIRIRSTLGPEAVIFKKRDQSTFSVYHY